MKPILFLLLPLALAAVWLPIDLKAQDFRYTVSDGQVTITGYNGPGGDVTIPERIEGLPVAQVGDYAFYGQNSVASVTIPHGVTNIGDRAFYDCTGLTSVQIPHSVTFIGDFAFRVCTSLTNVTIPDSVTFVGAFAFSDCTGLTSVQIPDSVTFIGESAFSGCAALSIVATGNGVIGIPAAAFSHCTGLTNIKLGTSVTRIHSGWHPPEGKPKLGSFEGCTSLTNVTIPDSVTFVGDFAFSRCTGLTNVTIPNSVTNIGWAAFGGCTSLVSVSIPDSVDSIGLWAFLGCNKLASISVDAGNANYSSLDGVLFNKARTTLIEYPGGKSGAYVVPNSVTSIGGYAFSDCTSLTSVTIPTSVTFVGDFACVDCTSLRSAYFMGDAPRVYQEYFPFGPAVTVYYRSGTTGWESTFGGRPAVLWIPEEDLDHDGMTNQQEFMAGTDPSDAQSLLALEGEARPDDLAEDDKTPLPPGQFALYFKSIPGRSYVIQSTEMLGGEWRQEATVAAGRATQKRVVLDRPPNKAFYRLQLDAAE